MLRCCLASKDKQFKGLSRGEVSGFLTLLYLHMQYQFVRLNNKIFIGAIILGFVLGMATATLFMNNREAFEFVLLLLIVIFSAATLGFHLSKRKYVLDLSHDEYLSFEGKTLYYKDMLGYFKFDEAPLGGAFGLLTSDLERHTLSSIFSGSKKAQFYEAQEQIVEKLILQNPNAKGLTYNEYYQKQMSFLRPVLYVLLGLVVVIDLAILLWLIPSGKSIPYQLWFMNLALLGVIPLLRKK